MTRKEILDTAEKTVCTDRNEIYGGPENSFQMIGDLWARYIREKCVGPDTVVDIGADDVAALMALFKIARIATGRYHADNWIDLAGYAACGGEIAAQYDAKMTDVVKEVLG